MTNGSDDEDRHHDHDDRPIARRARSSSFDGSGGLSVHLVGAKATRQTGQNAIPRTARQQGGFCVFAETMLEQLTILAPGLIGGSVARAARARGLRAGS